MGFDGAGTDALRDLPVAERDVVGRRGIDVAFVHEPAPVQVVVTAHEVAMGHDNLVAGDARRRHEERRHIDIVHVGRAAYLEVEAGDDGAVLARDAQHVDVGRIGEAAAAVGRVRRRRVVVAGKHDYRQRRVGERAGDAVEHGQRHAVRVEDIAGEQQDIGGGVARGGNDEAQHLQAVALSVRAQVKVRRMDEDDLALFGCSHVLMLSGRPSIRSEVRSRRMAYALEVLMRRRWMWMLMLAVGSIAVFAACGNGNGGDGTPAARTAVASPTAAAAVSPTAVSTPAATPGGEAVDACSLRTSLEGGPLSDGPSFALDDEVAWQMCIGGAAAGSSEKFLFGTGDGGVTWLLLSMTTLGNPPPEAGIGELPNGNAAEVLFFVDAETGWLGLSSPGENLFRSDDGGVTWTFVDALPPGLPVTDISFTDAQNGMAMTPQGMWTTTDGGATWMMMP